MHNISLVHTLLVDLQVVTRALAHACIYIVVKHNCWFYFCAVILCCKLRLAAACILWYLEHTLHMSAAASSQQFIDPIAIEIWYMMILSVRFRSIDRSEVQDRSDRIGESVHDVFMRVDPTALPIFFYVAFACWQIVAGRAGWSPIVGPPLPEIDT